MFAWAIFDGLACHNSLRISSKKGACMTSISYKKLDEYNQKGLIPGPEESEEAFIERAEYCLNLETEIFKDEQIITEPLLQEPLKKSEALYGIKPDWIPLFFSNERLSPWQGGCVWIFQINDDSPTSALLQMRKGFAIKKKYLLLYDRDELITHELAHVGRMAFQEPKFEEILAYQSSSSWYRKILGPLFQASWESMLFVLMLMAIVFFDLFLILMGHLDLYFQLMWLKALPVVYVTLLLIRLIGRYRAFSRCKTRVKSLLPPNKDPLPFIYRLTDKEIIAFGSWSKEQIQEYIAEQKDHSLRWRTLEEQNY